MPQHTAAPPLVTDADCAALDTVLPLVSAADRLVASAIAALPAAEGAVHWQSQAGRLFTDQVFASVAGINRLAGDLERLQEDLRVAAFRAPVLARMAGGA